MVIKYTERLHEVLVRRANYVTQRVRKCTGGIPRQKFLQNSWELKLKRDEIELTDMTDKICSLQSELSRSREVVDRVETENDNLRQRVAALTDKESCITTPPTSTTRKRGRTKSFDQYSESHKRRLKRSRTSSCQESLKWLENDGLIPVSVQVKNIETGERQTISLQTSESGIILGPSDQISDASLDTLNMLLYVKNSYNISGCAYHELASICKGLPKHYTIKQRIQELNKMRNIRSTPNGIVGVQQSLEDRLRVRLRHLISASDESAEFRQKKELYVKLSGDGTCIGKRLHVITFGFTLLEEGSKAHSFEGNHILAVFRAPEDYDSLESALSDIRDEVERLKTIECEGTVYKINYRLGGDWKFLATVTGIDSASSNYACIWCKCSQAERFDMEKEWSISDKEAGARTVEETVTLAHARRSQNRYNVSHVPLFPSIPLTNVVIDNLHMFLRVSDVLTDLLILELRRQDFIEKKKTFSSFDPDKYKHLDGFQKFVSSLGVPDFKFYIGQRLNNLNVDLLLGLRS